MCLKSIENFVGVALLIWMPHPFLKNDPDTYETLCIALGKMQKIKIHKIATQQ